MFLWQQNQLLQNRCSLYDYQLEQLQSQVVELERLRAEVAELRERLGQNSQNSSKPPSSVPPSVPRSAKRESSGRKPGGQPGHEGHGRRLLPPERVDHIVELRPVSCQECGHLLLGDDPEPARRQISELPRVKAVNHLWNTKELLQAAPSEPQPCREDRRCLLNIDSIAYAYARGTTAGKKLNVPKPF